MNEKGFEFPKETSLKKIEQSIRPGQDSRVTIGFNVILTVKVGKGQYRSAVYDCIDYDVFENSKLVLNQESSRAFRDMTHAVTWGLTKV